MTSTTQTSKARNALVEAGLVTFTIVLAAFGMPLITIAVMTGVGLGWWFFVQAPRLRALWTTAPIRVVGAIGIALMALCLGHAFGFGIGAALHSSLRFS
jgi:hypothetical protein